jgi:hypothetical protein
MVDIMKNRSLIAAFAFLLVFGACNESTGPVIRPNDITGKVLDVDGRPIANAAIALELEFEDVAPSPADKPTLGIHFTLGEESPVQFWIASFCDDDTVRTLISGLLPAGSHEVFWNGLDDTGCLSPDGVYWAHVETPAGSSVTPVLMASPGYRGLPEGREVAPQATSTGDGRFRVGQGCLPFEFEFPAGGPYGATGLAITRRVRVWALHDDYVPDCSDWVTIDADGGASVVITLSR